MKRVAVAVSKTDGAIVPAEGRKVSNIVMMGMGEPLPFYRRPAIEISENLELIRVIDKTFMETPWYGSRQIARHLRHLTIERPDQVWCAARPTLDLRRQDARRALCYGENDRAIGGMETNRITLAKTPNCLARRIHLYMAKSADKIPVRFCYADSGPSAMAPNMSARAQNLIPLT